MKSLTNLLEYAAPELSREPSLVSPVMTAIRRRQRSRAVVFYRLLVLCLGAAGVIAILSAACGNLGTIIALAVQRAGSITQHPDLYLNAAAEATPWLALASLAGLAGAGWYAARHQTQLVRFRSRLALASLGTLMATGVTSATALATINTQPGPALHQLERTLNSVGATAVTIAGNTYEFNTGATLSDDQLKAHDELQWIYNNTHNDYTLTPSLQHNGDTQLARIVTATADSITYEPLSQTGNAQPVVTVSVNADTRYWIGQDLQSQLALQPGDLVEIATRMSGPAGLIAKLKYSLADYLVADVISQWTSIHGDDGRCIGNLADVCPNLPASYNIWSHVQPTRPADAEVQEVFGRITSMTPSELQLTTSSGHEWTFKMGAEIADFNSQQTGLSLQTGDLLRIQFWQHNAELGSTVVYAQQHPANNQPSTKNDALALQSGQITSADLREYPIQMVQIALKQPWLPGTTPVKY